MTAIAQSSLLQRLRLQFTLGCRTMSAEERRVLLGYRRMMLASFLVYMGTSQFAEHLPSGPARLAFAACSGILLCTFLFFTGVVIYKASDEFRRHLLAQSFIAASIFTMALAALWGYLEIFSHGGLPRMPVLLMPAILICATAAAKVIIFRQHRVSDE